MSSPHRKKSNGFYIFSSSFLYNLKKKLLMVLENHVVFSEQALIFF